MIPGIQEALRSEAALDASKLLARRKRRGEYEKLTTAIKAKPAGKAQSPSVNAAKAVGTPKPVVKQTVLRKTTFNGMSQEE